MPETCLRDMAHKLHTMAWYGEQVFKTIICEVYGLTVSAKHSSLIRFNLTTYGYLLEWTTRLFIHTFCRHLLYINKLP